jgi:hypothetical protein
MGKLVEIILICGFTYIWNKNEDKYMYGLFPYIFLVMQGDGKPGII